MRISANVHEARLSRPFVSSQDAVTQRRLVLVNLQGPDGLVGHGEAAPLPAYHGVTVERVLEALDSYAPALVAADGEPHADVLARCEALAAVPQALAAIDMALWDLAGRQVGEPVWRLLGASTAAEIALNATIGALDPDAAAGEASRAVAAGFEAVKLKVGVGDDAGRLAATRAAAGRELMIRIDANGAWTPEQAIANLRELAPAGVECCEEPTHGASAIARVAVAVDVPLSIDESATDPGALEQRACAAVCLKLAACGGITGLLAAARGARQVGYEVYISSSLDGPLGIAAALHAAAVIDPDRACGLATLGMFENRDPLPPRRGRLAPPEGPGLGGPWLDWYGTPLR